MNKLGLTSKFFLTSTPEKWVEAKRAGFETAELVFPPDLPPEPMFAEATLRREHILAAGLEILSAHTPFGPGVDPSSANTEQRRVSLRLEKKVIDQIAEWEIPLAVYHASFEPIGEDERAQRLRIAADSVRELSDYAAARGVTLAVEELPRTCIGHNAAEMLKLVEGAPHARMTFDFNHLLLESHEAFIDATAPYIVTTHLSDYDFVDEKHWMPGVGQVEWKRVVDHLLSKGYSGQILFETYEQRAIPGEHCTPQRIMDTWKRLMRGESLS